MQLFSYGIQLNSKNFRPLLYNFLFQAVDNSPLVLFRILFGLLIFLECSGAIFTGWVQDAFIDPAFIFTFIGFEWLHPLEGNGMYYYYAVMAITGLMVMLGLYYRIGIFIFFILWTLSYLMQKSIYNNHYYMLVLLSFIMMFLPAEKYFSLDVRQKRTTEALSCDKWCIWVLIMQVSLVYIFAGIAKLYPDWLEGRPVEVWFKAKADDPFLGKYLQLDLVRKIVIYGGLFFDLLIVPLLLWKRTRVLGFILGLFFHLFNSAVFLIGIFPFLMISLNMMFFPPEIIRNLFFRSKAAHSNEINHNEKIKKKIIFSMIVIYFLIQIYLPLRHLFYEGNVYWTEEGHRMSWHMMVRSKKGEIYFKIYDPFSERTWLCFPEKEMPYRQYKVLANAPDIIWQYAGFLKEQYKLKGYHNVEIYAFTKVSLNGRKPQALIDSTVNLAKSEWTHFNRSKWILPLKE
jgi:vitamin K-dependent gamma-carboxylase